MWELLRQCMDWFSLSSFFLLPGQSASLCVRQGSPGLSAVGGSSRDPAAAEAALWCRQSSSLHMLFDEGCQTVRAVPFFIYDSGDHRKFEDVPW